MARLLLKNGKIVLKDKVKKADILIENGTIKNIASEITDSADSVINLSGKTVMSGFVDLHCHLREPGFIGKEDILSGSSAAVKGGFTDICCMPNTNPVIDSAVVVEYIKGRASAANMARVHIIGSATKGQEGKELSEIGLLKEAGIVAVSDDGKPIENAQTMKLCMQYAADFNLKVFSHCESMSLTDGGVVNDGVNAIKNGLKGIPAESEEVMVAREIVLSKNTGLPVHLCHISTKGSIDLIKDAKARGVKVTAETCPHYYSGTDELISGFNTSAKVNPPLRSQSDVDAIKQAIAEGVIDVIATDHAPHKAEEKDKLFNDAPFGISGFETAFALSYTNLVLTKIIDIVKLNSLMSLNASDILNIQSNEIRKGLKANLAVVDLASSYVIDSSTFVSKGNNTPFDGQKVYGEVVLTIVDGEVKYNKI